MGSDPIHGSAHDGEDLLVTYPELPHVSDEFFGFAGRDLPGGRRSAGDEGPVSSPGLETTGKLQLAIRAGHRVDGQAEIGGELTDRREPDGGEKSATVDGGGNLFPDLLKRGHRRVGIQDNKVDQINQIRRIHVEDCTSICINHSLTESTRQGGI